MCFIVDPNGGFPSKPPLLAPITKYGPASIDHTEVIDKFGSLPGFQILVTEYISVKEADLVPNMHRYTADEMKDISSVGATDDEIFFFKAFTQWRKLVGTAAMSRQMTLVDVHNLKDRPEWQTRMTALNKSIQQTMQDAAKFYEYLDQTLDKTKAAGDESKPPTQAVEAGQ